MELSLLLPMFMLLLFDEALNPLNASCWSSWWHSSLTMLLLFDATQAPPQRHSSLMLLVLLLLTNTTSHTPLQQPSSSMLLMLLLFFDIAFPTLPWCDTVSSLMWLLLHTTPALPILGTSLLPLDVVVVDSRCCSYFSYFRLVLPSPFMFL